MTDDKWSIPASLEPWTDEQMARFNRAPTYWEEVVSDETDADGNRRVVIVRHWRTVAQ